MTKTRVVSAPLFYLSHHKCATMYADSILGRICHELGLTKQTFYDPEDFGADLNVFIKRKRPDLVCYLDAHWTYVSNLDEVYGIHVVRDPRDILVSAYFSHLHSHQTETWPELRQHRQRLENASKHEGLHLELEFTGYVFEAMQSWDYNREGILELKFETLASNPYQFWLRVASHLGLLRQDKFGLRRSLVYDLKGLWNQAVQQFRWLPPTPLTLDRIPAQRLLGIAYDNRFESKSGGRTQGQTDPKSHYRKGAPGDWKSHLAEEHIERLEGEYPQLLAKTGYAS